MKAKRSAAGRAPQRGAKPKQARGKKAPVKKARVNSVDTKPPKPRPARLEQSNFKWPKLAWDDGEWTADVVLPTWKWHLRAIVTPFGTSRRRSTGKARLRVLTADDDRAEPTSAQAKAYAYLVEHQEAIRDALLRAAMKEFNKFLDEHVDELNDELFCRAYGRFPKRVSQPELPRRQIKLSSIYLHAADKSGVAYVGYSFDCDWEDEHGLGMLTHRRRVLVAGHADVSWSSDAYESSPPAVSAKTAVKKPRRTSRR